MNKNFKYLYSALLGLALGVSTTACDDWTEPESIDLNYGTIDQADPEAYAKYLADLREYRGREHKKVYAWFDNVAEFGSQGHRITALPDSIDVIVLTNPGAVTDKLVGEMNQVRNDKGMQISYCIDFNAIKKDWTLKCEELAARRLEFIAQNGEDAEIPAELTDPTFNDFMTQAWMEQLSYFNAVGFDGIMAAFDGKATQHLTPAELAEYNSQANLFLGILNDWHQRNPSVPVDYIGKPQNIASHPILNDFRTVFLSEGLSATNARMFDIIYAEASGTVADSKLGMPAYIHAVNTSDDPKTGIFSDGTYAIDGLSAWTAANNVGAVGIFNTANDYFISAGHYTTVRNLIQTVNPCAK